MAEFFLSYSHDATAQAMALRVDLIAGGHTVWVDDAGSVGVRDAEAHFLEGVGIPPGQPHWDIITAAIAESGTFMISLDETWPRKEYCVRELRHALTLGRRVAVMGDPRLLVDLPPDAAEALQRSGYVAGRPSELAGVLVELEPGRAAAQAQVRLADVQSAPTGWRLLTGSTAERVRDAELVLLDAGRGPAFPQWTALDRARAGSVLQARRQRRTWLQRGGAALMTALALTAGVSVAGWQASVRDRDRARIEANHAEGLNLADQADRALGTDAALALATRAVSLTEAPRAGEALRAAQYRSDRLSQFEAPPGNYLAAAVSPDGSSVALGHSDGLTLFDLRTGNATSAQVGPTLAIEFDDAGRVGALLRRDYGVVAAIVNDDGTVERISDYGARALRPDGDAFLIGLGDGRIVRVKGPGEPSAWETVGRLETAIRALDITRDRLVVLSEAGQLASFPRDGESFSQTPSITLDLTADFGAEPPVWVDDMGRDAQGPVLIPPGDGFTHAADFVRICGDLTHVVVRNPGVLVRSRAATFDREGRLVGQVARTTHAKGLACLPGSSTAWYVGALSTTPSAMPPAAWAPYGILSAADRSADTVIGASPDGTQVALAHRSGLLQVLRAPALQRTIGSGRFALPVADGLVVIDGEGHAALIGSDGGSRDLGTLPSAPTAGAAGRESAFLAVEGGVFRVDDSGLRKVTDDTHVDRLSVSRDGQELLVMADQLTAVPMDGSGRRPYEPFESAAGESITEMLLDGERLVVATTSGRVLLVSPDGSILHQSPVGEYGPHLLVFGPDGGYLTLRPDGFLRRWGSDLSERGARQVGGSPIAMVASPDSSTVVLTDARGETSVWDAASLEREAVIAAGSLGPRMRMSADGRSVVLVRPAGNEAGDTGEMFVLPLP